MKPTNSAGEEKKMKHIRVYLIALLAVAMSGGSLLLSAAPTTQALTDKDVVVTNTTANPVPVSVQGATAITGDVNIANTPSVNVANSPTVQINNSPSSPLLVRDVDNPARHPFQQFIGVDTIGYNGFSRSFSVPAGQRVIIEHVSASGYLPEGSAPELLLACKDGSQDIGIGHALLMTKQLSEYSASQGYTRVLWVAGQQIQCAADSEEGSLSIHFIAHGLTQDVSSLFWHISVSGYTVTP